MQSNSHIENKIYQAVKDYDNPRGLKILLMEQKTIQAIQNNSDLLQGAINYISENPPLKLALNNNYEEILSLLLKADNQRSKLLWAIKQTVKKNRIGALKLLLAADNQRSNLQIPIEEAREPAILSLLLEADNQRSNLKNIIMRTSDVNMLQLLLAAIKEQELQLLNLGEKIKQACIDNNVTALLLLLKAAKHLCDLREFIKYAYTNNLPDIFEILLQEDNNCINFDLQDAFNTAYDKGYKKILEILVTSVTPTAILKIDLLPLIKKETESISSPTEILSLLLQADHGRSNLGELIKNISRRGAVCCLEQLKLLLQADDGRNDLRHAIVYAALLHDEPHKLLLLLQMDKQQTDLKQIIPLVKLVKKRGRARFSLLHDSSGACTEEDINDIYKFDNDDDFNEFRNYCCISSSESNAKSLEALQKAADMQLLCKKFPEYCKHDSLATLTLYSLARREAIDISPNPCDESPIELFNEKDEFIQKAEKVINYITDIKISHQGTL